MDPLELDHEIRTAIAAHEAWTRRLSTAINLGNCETAPADIAVDDKCDFGQWLYGPTFDEATRAGKPYQVTRRLHAEFHDVAARVAAFAEAGQKSQAYALLDGEYTEKSGKLMRALTKWRGELETPAH